MLSMVYFFEFNCKILRSYLLTVLVLVMASTSFMARCCSWMASASLVGEVLLLDGVGVPVGVLELLLLESRRS